MDALKNNITEENRLKEKKENNEKDEEKEKKEIKKEEKIKTLQAEYDAIRAKERKEMCKSIAKYAVPIIILIAAFAIYFFVFKKKKIGK